MDGSYEISNSKGIWVRDHQHRAIGGQLKEVRSSQNHWCQMAKKNRFGHHQASDN